MRFERIISAIDTHTAGEPTRNILGGIPPIPGGSMEEKMLHLRDHRDTLRTMLMFEPRGHSVMSGTILSEPCDQRADIGVIYMETGGYLPMCGHDTIGVATALVEAGIVDVEEPITEIALDTPAGLVRVRVKVESGVARSVTFENIPSFLLMRDVTVQIPEVGEVNTDIAYGGNFYALVEASTVGIPITPENAGRLVRAGKAIRRAINQKYHVIHPDKPFIDKLTHVEFYGPPKNPQADLRNAVVIPPGAIDRSPCGTGTSAKLAALVSRGELDIGSEFVHESIIGTIFRAKAINRTEVGGLPAVVTEITGSAYVTGINQYVVDPDDPLKEGFLLFE